jgi:hypothetical protein
MTEHMNGSDSEPNGDSRHLSPTPSSST